MPAESPLAPALDDEGAVATTWLCATVEAARASEPSTPRPPPNAFASPMALVARAVLDEKDECRIVAATQPDVACVQSSSPAMSTPPVVAWASTSLGKRSDSTTVLERIVLCSIVSFAIWALGARKNGVLVTSTPPPSAKRPLGGATDARLPLTVTRRMV